MITHPLVSSLAIVPGVGLSRGKHVLLWLVGCLTLAPWCAMATPERPQTFAYRASSGDGPALNLDLYASGASDGSLAPVLIWLHRTGVSAGGTSAVRAFAEFAARHGYLLASIDYRLPTGAEDLAHAVAWLHEHAARHGGDPAALHLIGQSDGALPAGLVAADPQYLATLDKSPAILRSVVLTEPDAALLEHVAPNRDIPPALILDTQSDATSVAKRLAEALREVGVRAERVEVGERHRATSIDDEPERLDGAIPKLLRDFLASAERGVQTLGADWVLARGALTAAPPMIPAPPALGVDPFSPTALLDDVRRYFHLGEHRTGTSVDVATSTWLRQRLTAAGIDSFEHGWQIAQFFPTETYVGAGDVQIDAWPVWTPKATPPDGVDGEWVRIADVAESARARGRIALVDATLTDRAALGPIDAALIDAGAIGAIYVCGRGGTGAYYAENVLRRFVGTVRPMPAVLIGTHDLARLEPEMTRTGRASLMIRGEFDAATRSANVVGSIDRGTPWIVVSTPSSGWFRAGGERGAGVALWLALAQWAAQRPTGASYLFVANSGHEFDFLGGRLLHADGHVPPPERTLVWLHLGASIATPAWQQTSDGFIPEPYISRGNLLASDAALLPLLDESFITIEALTPAPYRPIGELRDIVENGYRAFGLVGGGNIWSHAHADTPRSVSPQALADVANALVAALTRIEAAANIRQGDEPNEYD
jgi:predicted esterase